MSAIIIVEIPSLPHRNSRGDSSDLYSERSLFWIRRSSWFSFSKKETIHFRIMSLMKSKTNTSGWSDDVRWLIVLSFLSFCFLLGLFSISHHIVNVSQVQVFFSYYLYTLVREYLDIKSLQKQAYPYRSIPRSTERILSDVVFLSFLLIEWRENSSILSIALLNLCQTESILVHRSCFAEWSHAGCITSYFFFFRAYSCSLSIFTQVAICSPVLFVSYLCERTTKKKKASQKRC